MTGRQQHLSTAWICTDYIQQASMVRAEPSIALDDFAAMCWLGVMS